MTETNCTESSIFDLIKIRKLYDKNAEVLTCVNKVT